MISNSRATATKSCLAVARTLHSSSKRPTPLQSEIPPKGIHKDSIATSLETHRLNAQKQLNYLLFNLNSSARIRAKAVSTTFSALELETKLREVGGKINRATGYEEIERLRLGVGEREKTLLQVREMATISKKAYSVAVTLRAASQREVNDLLQRKSSWSSEDVIRFTELVRQDHANEKSEMAAKLSMEIGEEGVEKGFSDLMQAILQRYHEEQVWSDKIRSLSTYGSLAITSLNVLLFIITILLVEPWKRKRLVEGVEARLRQSTTSSAEATVSSIRALQNLLQDAQSKLDLLLLPSFSSSSRPTSFDDASQIMAIPELTDEELLLDYDAIEASDSNENTVTIQQKGMRERELVAVGVGGALAGVAISLLLQFVGIS